MDSSRHAESILSLHGLVTDSADVQTVLKGLTCFAADAVTKAAGEMIECAVTLRRSRRTSTVAGSSDQAVMLDRIEQTLGQGPCLEALDLGRPRLLEDASAVGRWPEYRRALTAAGCRSALGVPMALGARSAAALNFFSPAAGAFSDAVVGEASEFAGLAASSLRLAIRIETAERLNSDLKTAMATRAVIDAACGVIMAQNHCSQDRAFEMLAQASNHRNEKLRDVAAEIIASLGAGPPDNLPHFQD